MRGDDDYERRSAVASRDQERLFAQWEQERAARRATFANNRQGQRAFERAERKRPNDQAEQPKGLSNLDQAELVKLRAGFANNRHSRRAFERAAKQLRRVAKR